MPSPVFLGFDFGYKRIGVAVGQQLTCSASPLATLNARLGVPDWNAVAKVIAEWSPQGLIVGIPTCIDGSELYTTSAARRFAKELRKRFSLPVHLVDERLSTVEAREQLFAQGGYRKIKQSEVDSIAACVILEQWLQYPE
ncbi:Holliday junction resolvase RuvX [Fluoribacter gormanii]|uniref:Putative pre-16S rRNA nuclease n=1 Tax=Fluoribacter gormanii TaxID=464 RepID=A0A377GMG2_9GAMM|nr:Holliday junction resolvase RuvX [Fluoribacter gormanii]KTD05608.1 Holliday junction resolvase [Fluoribacter gormanii]MCW8442608.1 Holliday junction resolvase RuvX [Fluoribacter gormanii]MCW8471098.1 Holliday junction resolvase RuvX [Fluoribacter gormanii]SIQ67385.1 putative holliday junction resolvase [Fluoribacter gormanii]STO25783.1 Putative Holliday junction resolvase [Fluoribacter gormanii]